MTEAFSVRKYLRNIKMPFCSGCGSFTVMNTFLKAAYELGHEDLSKFVFCSGIGCAAWIPSPHFVSDSVHTPHGRSIAVATGIKLMRPQLNVVVFGGDGDIVGIGMGHFVHAARKNLDVLVIMVNNMIYGMTGGQVAPTTPLKTKTTTTPYGSFEQPIDSAKLAATAGATYVARWTTAQPNEMKESIKKALGLEGFRFIETVSQCPTAFGRRAGFADAKAMLEWFRNNTITTEEARTINQDGLSGKIVTGEFVQTRRQTLLENVYGILAEAQSELEKN